MGRIRQGRTRCGLGHADGSSVGRRNFAVRDGHCISGTAGHIDWMGVVANLYDYNRDNVRSADGGVEECSSKATMLMSTAMAGLIGATVLLSLGSH